MWWVVTNLVTSLDFHPIRCAKTLFHFGWTRNVYVATRIILLSSTAESSATGGYVVATEPSCQSEAWAGTNVERATKKLSSFVPNSRFIRCRLKTLSCLVFINFISLYFKLFFTLYFGFFLLWKFLPSFVYVIIFCVGAGVTTLMSIFNGSDP